jgi:hypothetical protein
LRDTIALPARSGVLLHEAIWTTVMTDEFVAAWS